MMMRAALLPLPLRGGGRGWGEAPCLGGWKRASGPHNACKHSACVSENARSNPRTVSASPHPLPPPLKGRGSVEHRQ